MIKIKEDFREPARLIYEKITAGHHDDPDLLIALIESNLNLVYTKGFRQGIESSNEQIKKQVDKLEK